MKLIPVDFVASRDSRRNNSRMRRRIVAAALLLCVVASSGTVSTRGQDNLAPQATLRQIAVLLERGDVSTASRVVEPALKTHPADPVLHNLAGVIAVQQGAFEPAETHFQTAIRLAPQSPAAYENLGRLYQERTAGNPAMRARAIAIYRRLLDAEPSSVEGLFQSGFLLALEGEFAASRAMLERLPQEIRQRPQALAVLAADLCGLGDTAGARRTVDALVAHPDLTEADVLAVLPAIPIGTGDAVAALMLGALDRRALTSPRALQALAAIHVRADRFVEARQLLERAVAAGGPSAPLLMELARTAVKVKDYDGALGYLAHARSLEPANATVHFLFGMVCVELNLGREAYESMKKAVQLDPDNAMVNYVMGAVATHRHEPSESLPYFEKYVRLSPDDPRGHFALGAARFYSNQFEEARPELERAARAPETATGAHYFLARIARQANDLTTARREIERALQLNADLADAWAELGLIQTRSNEYGPAEQSLAKALAIDPAHYAASVNLATLFSKTKDPRRERQMATVAALIEKREARAQEFLRIIKAEPYGR
jgi:tetratricopeptide (TPR) repeat protein